MTETLRPLLITSDPLLLDDVVRLAAAAGIELTVHAEPTASAWSHAPLVFVGDDALTSAASRALPRRESVIVVRRGSGLADDRTPASTWQGAVALGAEHVAELPDAGRWMVDRLAESGDMSSPGGPVISCVPGVGGAGATTLAAILAREARGLLVDVDPYGPAIPVDGGVRWQDLSDTRGRIPPGSLRTALPSVHGTHVLTGTPEARYAVPGEALASVLESSARGFPCTIVDSPRCDSETSRLAWARSDAVVIVIGPHPASAARVPALIDGIQEVCTRVVVVARTGPRDSGVWCAAEASHWEVPVLPPFRHDRSLAQGDHPYLAPRSAGRRVAREILDYLAPGARP
jgi:secretion/DNA translocation related CpaE-like protein